MKAAPEDQHRLLELARIDQRLRRANSDKQNPPQAARVKELVEQRSAQRHDLAAAVNARDDVAIEVKKTESDVTLTSTRLIRDRKRLDDASSVKDAQALEHEIDSLTRRLSDLEDVQLEAMQRLEEAEARVAAVEGALQQTADEGARLSAAAKQHVADAEAVIATLTDDRLVVSTSIPADLRDLYTKIDGRGTPGAGLFTRGTCGGCNVMLSPSDVQLLRAAAPDDVVTCPECGAVLVRTEESGI